MNFKIKIIMGSDSDWKIMEEAHNFLNEQEFNVESLILSAHRTPNKLEQKAREFEQEGVKIIIAGAGGAAHLPGMMASFTHIPVIGVPIQLTVLNGLDSLLSIVQMPKGVPVATVAINNAYNAGVLAMSICAAFDSKLDEKMKNYKKNIAEASQNKKLPL